MIQSSIFDDIIDSFHEVLELLDRDIRIGITGSRSITSKQIVYKYLNTFVKKHNIDLSRILLNSGHANGVDKLAEEWAIENNIPVRKFIPSWNLGKHAGHLRNKDIVKNSDIIIAIHDGESKGTANCIKEAQKFKVKCVIYIPNNKDKK